MSWYAIDAVDRAFSRTKKALFEPFDFWKWVKFAIIVFFVGGLGQITEDRVPIIKRVPVILEVISPISNPARLLIFLPIRPGLDLTISSPYHLGNYSCSGNFLYSFHSGFFYIASVMEFVFVEALVRNEVHLRSYFRKFMGRGFNLLLIRLVISLIIIVLFVLALLPFIPIFSTESPDLAVPALVGGLFWIFGVIILLALIGAVAGSFLSLAIPLSIYRETGIISAFRMVYRNFRKSWQELLVYWFIRVALGIGIGIFAFVLFVLLALVLVIVFLIIDGILYFLFSTFASESILLIILIPVVLAELLLIFATLLILSVPLAVFLKYHLLSFLETWFADASIPFFDELPAEPETVLGSGSETGLSESEQYSSEQTIPEQSESESQSGSESPRSGQRIQRLLSHLNSDLWGQT
jgi:hypothetical protein